MVVKFKRQKPRTLWQSLMLVCLLGGVLAGTATTAVGQGRDIPVIRMNDAKVIVTNPAASGGESVNATLPAGGQTSAPNIYSTERSASASQPVRSGTAAPLQMAQGVGSSSGGSAIGAQNPLWELYSQVQQLAEEVRYLRGMVESAQNNASQLDRKQKQNYVDLDERLMRLEQAAGLATASVDSALSAQKANATEASTAASASGVAGSASKAVAKSVGVGAPAESLATPPVRAETGGSNAIKTRASRNKATASTVQSRLSEKQAYEKVYRRLEAKEFAAAKSGFEAFIKDYPNGEFMGSALFWLSELSLRQKVPDEQAALRYIDRLVEGYPQHARIPDALYKQATLKYRRQDVDAAREIFEQILREHPDTTAARLADHQLRRIDGSL